MTHLTAFDRAGVSRPALTVVADTLAEAIDDGCLDVYTRGEVADLCTVAREIVRRCEAELDKRIEERRP